MGVARVGRCETRARYECPGDRGILQQGSAAHDAWYHYIASAACSSLSCASSSSSTAVACPERDRRGQYDKVTKRERRTRRTVFHSARSCRMVYGHLVRHEPVVELLLLEICQLLLELVLGTETSATRARDKSTV